MQTQKSTNYTATRSLPFLTISLLVTAPFCYSQTKQALGPEQVRAIVQEFIDGFQENYEAVGTVEGIVSRSTEQWPSGPIMEMMQKRDSQVANLSPGERIRIRRKATIHFLSNVTGKVYRNNETMLSSQKEIVQADGASRPMDERIHLTHTMTVHRAEAHYRMLVVGDTNFMEFTDQARPHSQGASKRRATAVVQEHEANDRLLGGLMGRDFNVRGFYTHGTKPYSAYFTSSHLRSLDFYEFRDGKFYTPKQRVDEIRQRGGDAVSNKAYELSVASDGKRTLIVTTETLRRNGGASFTRKVFSESLGYNCVLSERLGADGKGVEKRTVQDFVFDAASGAFLPRYAREIRNSIEEDGTVSPNSVTEIEVLELVVQDEVLGELFSEAALPLRKGDRIHDVSTREVWSVQGDGTWQEVTRK